MKKHTLDILVPRYNEDFSTVKPLLDSINIQQGVDFGSIRVIICSDGTEFEMTESQKSQYGFRIETYKCKHRGVSATRNSCLSRSKAEYVMFCDCDDMFCSACGLWIVFREMEEGNGFDGLTSMFIEESKDRDGNKIFTKHELDSTFVHGKVWRRKYLRDNNLKFDQKLTIHEDSYFNILAQNCSENVKYCPQPFYLWKWRDSSVCRHDPKYILKTYNNMIDSNMSLVIQFMERKMTDKVKFFVSFMILDAYYTMNKPEWKNQENQRYRNETELRFKRYYRQFKDIWNAVSDSERMQISTTVRSRNVLEGMQMENTTIEDWLSHVLTLGD